MENVILKVSLDDGGALNKLTQINSVKEQISGKAISIQVDTAGLEKADASLLKVLQAQQKIAVEQAKTARYRAQEAAERAKAATAAAKQAAAAQKTAQEQAKAAAAASKEAAEKERTAQKESALMTQMERTNTERQKAETIDRRRAILAEQMASEIETGELREQANLAVQKEKTAQAEAKIAVQTERTNTESKKAEVIEQRRALLAEKMAAANDRAVMSATGSSATEMEAQNTAIQNRIEAMVGLNRETKSAAQSASVFEKAWLNASDQTASYLQTLGTNIGTLDRNVTNGISGVQKYIRSLDGMSSATVKANGLTSVGGDVFQTYTATVKNADGSFQNYTYSVNKATGATYQLDQGVTSANTALVRTGDTLTSMIGKFAQWYLIGALVTTPIQQFKKAVEELKNVDTELVTIQKVTNATTKEMEALADSAYDVAAAYGSTASNYLNSVSEFAKAGYKDLSDELGQLSLKTQVVGDVDKDTANQFLLSVQAAYKYEDAVSGLSAVLDGANQIGNEYATSVQKIAEGLGTVSSIAESAHTSIGSLTAAVGTITAVTQRSGSEAARALRAIYLNILGNTELTLDEDSDETWTAEEIQAMADALKKFNIATRETVDGVEQLRDPMEVIGDIAMQWEKGLISEVDLNDLIQELGGKLRSNQLMALIENWDMYEAQLKTFENAAGSADQEFGIYLNSWEAKLNQLSAAWTKFVAEFGIEDFIKNVITLGTELLNAADNGVVQFTVKTIALAAALTLAGKAIGAAKTGMVALNVEFLKSPLGVLVAVGTVIYAVSKGVDALTTSFEEQQEVVEDLQKQYDELTGVGSEYEDLKNRVDDLTEAEKRRLSVLQAEAELKEKELKDAKDKEWEKFNQEQGTGKTIRVTTDYDDRRKSYRSEWVTADVKQLNDLQSALSDVEKQYQNGEISIGDYRKELQELLTDSSEYIEYLRDAKSENRGLSDAQEEAIQIGDNLIFVLDNLTGGTKDAVSAHVMLEAQCIKTSSQAVDLTNRLADEAEQAGITADELSDLTAQSVIFNNTNLNVSQKLNALQQLAAQAGLTAEILSSFTGSGIQTNYQRFRNAGLSEEEAMAKLWESWQNKLKTGWQGDYVPTKSNISSGSGTKSETSSSSSTEKDPELERLKDIVTLRKSELSLMQARGDSTEDQIAKMREIQSALHDEAEYLRSIGGDQAEINALSTEHWEITNQINDLLKEQEEAQKKLWSELEDYVDTILKNAQDARDAATAAIDEQINGLKDEKEQEDDLLQLEEKRLDVEKARQDLLNAQNERTVRQIQADGNWKWVADASKVSSAQDALDEAEDALNEFEKELAYNAVIEDLEQQKKTIEEQYDAFEKEWEAIKSSVEEPSRDISEILTDIAENGVPAMQEAVIRVTAILNGLAGYIEDSSEIGIASTENGGISGGGGSDNSDSGGYTGYSGGIPYDKDRNYAADMLNAESRDAFEELNSRREAKIEGEGITGVQSYEDLLEEWESKQGGSYDSGGIANGIGTMRKATREREVVLGPELTSKILEPQSNAQFTSFVKSMGLLFGTAKERSPGSAVPGSVSSTDRHDVSYYINGVKIGSDAANMPLSRILSTLPLHVERN